MVARLIAAPSRLDTDQFDRVVFDKGKKHARGIAAAADTGDHDLGQAAQLGQTLLTRLAADD